MKKVLISVLAIAALYFGYKYFVKEKSSPVPEAPKDAPMSSVKHSAAFNESVSNVVNHYLQIKDAFVEADTVNIKSHTKMFIAALDSIKVEELKKDTAAIFETATASIADIKSNAASLLQQTDVTEMRRDFSMITEMMYPAFFKAINYEGVKLYVQNCPMAFGEGQAANWLSNNKKVVNPYLGKNHPKYKDEMLGCGEVKDSIVSQ